MWELIVIWLPVKMFNAFVLEKMVKMLKIAAAQPDILAATKIELHMFSAVLSANSQVTTLFCSVGFRTQAMILQNYCKNGSAFLLIAF